MRLGTVVNIMPRLLYPRKKKDCPLDSRFGEPNSRSRPSFGKQKNLFELKTDKIYK
jgi:hypothetical protein